MTFKAKYGGRCAGCDDRIRPADDVEYVEDELVHEGCRPLVVADRPDRPQCPECFTETSVNGACACVS